LSFTTTASQKWRLTNDGGDGSLRRSLAGVQKQNTGSLLYPGGGREGWGDEWGAERYLAKENPKTTKQKSPEGNKKGSH
jgi:hypothetical protein